MVTGIKFWHASLVVLLLVFPILGYGMQSSPLGRASQLNIRGGAIVET
jgi:hypothetical protein